MIGTVQAASCQSSPDRKSTAAWASTGGSVVMVTMAGRPGTYDGGPDAVTVSGVRCIATTSLSTRCIETLYSASAPAGAT